MQLQGEEQEQCGIYEQRDEVNVNRIVGIALNGEPRQIREIGQRR